MPLPPPSPLFAPKKGARIEIRIMEVDDDASSSTTTSTEESSDYEEFADDLATFKEQVHTVYMATEQLNRRLLLACERAAEEEEEVATADAWMGPQRPIPTVEAWLTARGVPTPLPFQAFFAACLDAAESLDLDTRTVTFRPEDAAILFGGPAEKRTVSVFELLSSLPAWFVQ
jgi:hypothetical protein